MSIKPYSPSSPTVSVFITAYNIAPYIGAAIESVLAQTFTDFEIVVAEDCSTDQTRAIIADYTQRYPNCIKAIFGDHNLGIPGNTNRALDACTGRYLAKLDGDDLWYPRKLEVQVGYMEAHPDVVLSYHDAEIFDSGSGATLARVSEVGQSRAGRLQDGDIKLLFKRFSGLSSVSLMFRAIAVGRTRYDERLLYMPDWLFDVEVLAKGGKIGAINEVLARYRRHSQNSTNLPSNRGSVLEENLIAVGITTSRYPYLAPLARRRASQVLRGEMIRTIQADDIRRSLSLLRTVAMNGDATHGLAVWLLYALTHHAFARRRGHSSYLSRRVANWIYR